MKPLKSLILLACSSLLLTGSFAVADEIIIIHRSGKIQTLQIDSAADPVEQVSFRRKAQEITTTQQPQPQPAPAAAAAVTQAPPAAKAETPAKAPEKSGVKIKWAEPMDAKY